MGMSVRVYVCLSLSISGLHMIQSSANCLCVALLGCDVLRTSGFVDDVMFARNGQ